MRSNRASLFQNRLFNRNRSNHSLTGTILAGAAGGLAGAFAMNQFQTAIAAIGRKVSGGRGQGSRSQDEAATVKTARAISRKLFDHELTRSEKKWAGPAVHFALGGLLGATYGALSKTAPVTKKGLGTAYGAAVWLGADEIAVPAFGLSRSPDQYPAGVHLQALASHAVFGLATDLTMRVLLRLNK